MSRPSPYLELSISRQPPLLTTNIFSNELHM